MKTMKHVCAVVAVFILALAVSASAQNVTKTTNNGYDTTMGYGCTGSYGIAGQLLQTGGAGQPCSWVNNFATTEIYVYPANDWICAKGGDTTIGIIPVTGLAISGTSATINVGADPRARGYMAGENITIDSSIVPSSLAGSYTISSVNGSTIVSATATAGQSGAYASGGNFSHICKNSADAISSGTAVAFASTITIPGVTSYPADYRIVAGFSYQTASGAISAYPPKVNYASTSMGWNAVAGLPSSVLFWPASQMYALQFPYSGVNFINPIAGFMGNGTSQQSWQSIVTTSPQTVSLSGVYFSATGIASGTYTSGGSITGTAGQTCTLTAFNGANTGGTATIALTGTNVIAGGTALTITNTGSGSTSAASTATLGSGTATCSGTATIATVLGGAQGNAIGLRSLVAKLQ